MKGKTIFFYVALMTVAFLGIFVTLNFPGPEVVPTEEVNQVMCTMEAKLCPDGSYVGRRGPKCEFTKCPDEIKDQSSSKDGVLISGIKITPIKLISDSRCPKDVQCVWAGTVIVEVKLEKNGVEKTVQIELGKPVVFSGSEISLEDVGPQPTQNKEIVFMNYSFVFDVDGIKKSI